MKGKVTFPLISDVVSDVQMDADICANPGWPVLAYAGFGNLHHGERHDGLGHSRPATEYHPAILRLPGNQKQKTGYPSKDQLLLNFGQVKLVTKNTWLASI